MIVLDSQKDYFILIDGQGAQFASGCIFESIEEVAERFQFWAESDEYEDPKLIGWSIGDCLSNWTFELKQYKTNDFIETDEKFINYIIKK